MSGIAIKVKTSFTRVLSDLSFIPYIFPDDMPYSGRYKGNITDSLKNISPSSTQSATVTGSRYTMNDKEMEITSTYDTADSNNNIGIRFNLTNMPTSATISAVFRLVTLPAITNYKVWPIASVWANTPNADNRLYPGQFCIGLWQDENGQKKLVMRSGSLQASEQNLDFASIPFDYTGSDAVYVTASRDSSGNAIMTAIINGVSHSIEYKFAAPTFPDATTFPRFYFGAISQRPLSARLLSGSVWTKALTLEEAEEANYRQFIVYR